MKIHKWNDIKNRRMTPEEIARSDRWVEDQTFVIRWRRTITFVTSTSTILGGLVLGFFVAHGSGAVVGGLLATALVVVSLWKPR
jgi:hypothetical protein